MQVMSGNKQFEYEQSKIICLEIIVIIVINNNDK